MLTHENVQCEYTKLEQICFYEGVHINPYKPDVLFCGTKANRADPDQTPLNAASDKGLHCLLTECSIKI